MDILSTDQARLIRAAEILEGAEAYENGFEMPIVNVPRFLAIENFDGSGVIYAYACADLAESAKELSLSETQRTDCEVIDLDTGLVYKPSIETSINRFFVNGTAVESYIDLPAIKPVDPFNDPICLLRALAGDVNLIKGYWTCQIEDTMRDVETYLATLPAQK